MPSSPSKIDVREYELNAVELNRIVLLPEAARLAGVSVDTLRRYYSDKFIRLSKQRQGMRVKHALMLNKPP
jgi:hypothetical protein